MAVEWVFDALTYHKSKLSAILLKKLQEVFNNIENNNETKRVIKLL